MNIRIFRWLFILAGLAMAPWSGVAAQEVRAITLEEAIREGRAHGPGVLAGAARARAAAQEERRTAAGLLPHIGWEAGIMRSDDPVAAFGSRLRQGRFTQQDFDPARLNHPDAVTDWSAAAGLGWTVFDLSRVAAVRHSAENARAAELGARWVERAAEFVVEARYAEAVGAEWLLDAARAAAASAEANLSRVSRRVAEGLLTEADLLRARAAAERAQAALIDADRQRADARGRLGLALGWEPAVTPIPADTSLSPLAASPIDIDVERRPDLGASAAELRAAQARVQEAERARLPRLEGFARLESHSSRAFSGQEYGWTAGLRIEIPVFTGFAISAAREASLQGALAAEAEHADRLSAARTEIAEARRAVEARGRGVLAAASAAEAASEAARLTRLRFEEGLVTTADLLAAEAAAAELSATAAQSRLSHRLATVHLHFLTHVDTDPTDLSGGLR